MSVNDGLTYRCGDCGRVPVGKGRPSINTCPACRGDFTWEVVTPPESPLSASLPASDGRRGGTCASDRLTGSCGHELDPWESHLEHSPDCRRELCIDDSRCTCPEVCPDCCRSCGYDLAERMGS